jgi:hypothetical protein
VGALGRGVSGLKFFDDKEWQWVNKPTGEDG